jgi:hypothetical protein
MSTKIASTNGRSGLAPADGSDGSATRLQLQLSGHDMPDGQPDSDGLDLPPHLRPYERLLRVCSDCPDVPDGLYNATLERCFAIPRTSGSTRIYPLAAPDPEA